MGTFLRAFLPLAYRRPTTDDETAQTVEKTAALLEELGHHIELVEAPVPDSFEDDFLLYWSAMALGLSAGGKVAFNRTYDRRKNDNLTEANVMGYSQVRTAATMTTGLPVRR